MLILHVTYKAKSGMANQFVEAVIRSGMDKTIRAEAGNLCYDYFFSVKNKDEVLLVEKWVNHEALAAHSEAPHMAVLRQIKGNYIEETIIEKYSVL